mmetsp:Transcript_104019/g.335410  ORF Transcript_104019/g.335410 Transcript_104019/m.335410 type:complete len:260 (+) Transcript_104019:647-1426(+)
MREVAVHRVLGAPLHPEREVAGHAVLVEVLPQRGHGPGLGPPDDVQLREVRGQDAHDDGGGHEGEDPDDRGVEALDGAPRRDLVHAARELRERPMQGDEVLGVDAPVLVGRERDPRRAARVAVADGPPGAGHEVGAAHHEDQQLEDAQDEGQLVRLDALRDVGDDLLHADQAQQPHDAHDAEDPREPGEAHAAALGRAQRDHGPVGAHDEEVEGEPRLGVALDDDAEGELHAAVVEDDARDGGPVHVDGPEEPRDPGHH